MHNKNGKYVQTKDKALLVYKMILIIISSFEYESRRGIIS